MADAQDTASVASPDTSRLAFSSDDLSATAWPQRSDSQPDLPSPGDEQSSILECKEDGASLGLSGPLDDDDAAAQPLEFLPNPFVPDDSRTAIIVELDRQTGLRCSPDDSNPAAQRFAARDRPRIVSWFVEVVSALRLCTNTLHSAVSIMDRFAAGTQTLPPEHVLQLLALACLSLAAKQEEVNQFRPEDWTNLAVNADNQPIYRREDLKRMEWLLLETVAWRIRVPNTFTFLRHFMNVVLHDPAMAPLTRDDPALAAAFRSTANMLAELSLPYSTFLQFSYSTIATACLVLAEWQHRRLGVADADAADAPAAGADDAREALLQTVAALTRFTGDANSLVIAPDLPACVERLHELHAAVAAPGPDGRPPPLEALGLLRPIVVRYRPRV